MTTVQLTKQLKKMEQRLVDIRRLLAGRARLSLPSKRAGENKHAVDMEDREWQERWNDTRGSIDKDRAKILLQYIETTRQEPDRGSLSP